MNIQQTWKLNLDQLAQRCEEESSKFYRNQSHDDRYCFELVRRAVLKRDERAWEAVVGQYKPQIAAWVQHTFAKTFGRSADPQDVEDMASEAVLKFLRSYGPDQFGKAAGLADVLRYWQDCARSAVIEWQRKLRKRRLDDSLDDDANNLQNLLPAPNSQPDEQSAQTEARWQLWNTVRQHCTDDADWVLIRAVYVEGLPPRQVHIAHPDMFESKTTVYRRLRNLKDRLRRNDVMTMLMQA